MNGTELVQQIEPPVIGRYLRARGWREEASQNPRLMRFMRSTDKGEVEVEIPVQPEFADYQRRIHEAMEILALVEGTSVSELSANLAMPDVDIVTFRFTGEASANGMISLDDSYRLRKARKQLLLAVAHSVVEPRSHFSRLSRTEPAEFLATCREAPSRPGSYVSPVIVPVSPVMGRGDLEAPFSRRVTELLARALAVTMEALARGNDDVLLDNAMTGLSSNFLTALAELAPPGGRGALDIDFLWSYSRPVPDVPRRSVRFGDGLFAPLAEAARVLRETTQVPGYELEGFVARLERDADKVTEPGTVVLATTLDDRPKTSKVHVTLDPETYQTAIWAHQTGTMVRITGTLVRRGRKLVLENPGEIDMLPDSD